MADRARRGARARARSTPPMGVAGDVRALEARARSKQARRRRVSAARSRGPVRQRRRVAEARGGRRRSRRARAASSADAPASQTASGCRCRAAARAARPRRARGPVHSGRQRLPRPPCGGAHGPLALCRAIRSAAQWQSESHMATNDRRRTSSLQELAKRHLWMHFSRMGGYERRRRDPDHRPRRGLPRLGRARQALLRRRSARCSASTSATAAPTSPRPAPTRPRSSASSRTGPTRTRARSSWPRASPTLAPGDLNRVFFTSGGGEAVESAIKLARQYHKLTGKPEQDEGHRARDRLPRHDARARSPRPASPRLRAPFEPFTPGGCHVPEHEPLPAAAGLRRRERSPRRSPSASSSRGRTPSPP